METLLHPFLTLLDTLYFGIISPLFLLLSQGLEQVLLGPLRLLQLPVTLQVMCVAVAAAALSLYIRKLIKVEEKEAAFKKQFTAKKRQQDDLHLISDWKSREKFAKAIDDDIDYDFNTYLAGRFARYGITYLLPIFLTLFWLDGIIHETFLIGLPASSGYPGLSTQFVFLLTYCTALFIYFRLRKKRLRRTEEEQATAAPTHS